MNARSQRRYLRPQGLQFILWIGHAGKLSHLSTLSKDFVLLKVGVLQGGAGIYACGKTIEKSALAAEAIKYL